MDVRYQMNLIGEVKIVDVSPKGITGGPPTHPADANNQAKGVTKLDTGVNNEAHAISKSNAWRTERPKRRPKRTKGHGIAHLELVDIGAKLKDKQYRTLTAVKPVAMPDFMLEILKTRPEIKQWYKGIDMPPSLK